MAAILTASLALVGLPAPAGAVEPPSEVRYVCVDQQSNISQADTPGACTSTEKVFTLPDDRPFHMCADSLGRLKHVAGSGCGARETLLMVPEGGPMFVCSQNVRGGIRLSRGALRYVTDISGCDRHESGFVTPAAPTAFDDSYKIDEDTVLDVPARGVLDNDRDLTGQPLRARLTAGVARGTLGLAPDGGFRFDPRRAFDGLDAGQSTSTTFTYVANDGALDSAVATATLVVTGRNDRPVAANDAYGTDEDTAVSTAAPGVLANDTDAEEHRLSATLVSGPDRGVLTLEADGSVRFTPSEAFEALDAGQTASAAFAYRATDGTDTSDTATAVVTVRGVNDAPVAGPDARTTDENTPLVLQRASLLANDTDAEGHALEIRDGDVSPPDRGGLDVASGQSLIFDPRVAFDGLGAGETATATFTYRAAEVTGGAVSAPVPVVITVTGVAPPDAVDDTARTSEDAAVEVDLFANDRLNEGRLVGISATSGGGTVAATATPGVVRYDPGAAFHDLGAGESRLDAFSYTLERDSEPPDAAVVTVIVEGRNDAPSAADDDYSLSSPHRAESRAAAQGVLANDSDVDADPLATRLVSPPQAGRLTLGADGAFTFDPAGELPDAGATVTFGYRATDGAAESRTATVTLHVGTNVVPAFDATSLSLTMVTDDGDGIVGRVTASDADNDLPLTFRFTDAAPAPFAIDPDGTIRFTAVPAPGTYTRSVQVQDARGGTTAGSVTIEVDAPLQAAPDAFRGIGNTELVAGGGSAAGAAQGGVVASVATGLLANDGGTEGERVSVEAFSGASALGGRVDVFADGSFVYLSPRPDPDGSGWDGAVPFVDSFTYRLLRHQGESELANVTVTVTDVVWHVDASAPAPGTGTAIAPYAALSSLTPVDPAEDDDGPGHVIFVRGQSAGGTPGLAYPNGVTLEDRQRLIGEGAGLSFGPAGSFGAYELVPPGPSPSLTPQTGTAVHLAADNAVKGLSVSSGGAGISGNAVDDLQLALPSVAATGGPGLDLAGGSDQASVAVTTVRSTSLDGYGIHLDRMGGTVTVGSADLTAGTGLVMTGSPASASISTLEARGGAVGLRLSETSGTVFVGELRASATEAAAVVTRTSGAVRIGKLVQASEGLSAGATITGNTGTVTVDEVDLPAVTAHGVRAEDTRALVRIGKGRLHADAGTFQGVLLHVSGARAAVEVGAALTLAGASGPPAQRPGGRSVVVSGLDGAGAVSFTGAIVDQGAGIELRENSGAGVRFSGGMSLDTGPHVSFYALSGGILEVGGSAQNVVSAGGATALRVAGVTIGMGGVRFDDVTSVEAPYVATDPKATGSGIDLNAVSGLGSAPSARLVVVAGRVEQAATSGVRVTASRNVTIGRVSVVESAAQGVRSSSTEDLVLEGTTVDRAGTDGIASTDDRRLLIDGASSVSSNGRGVSVAGVVEAITLRNTSAQRSLGTQVEVSDVSTDGGGRDVLLLEGTSVGDGIEEETNVVVRSSGDSRLTVRTGGATPTSIVGGGIGLDAVAVDGGDLAVELTNLLVARTGGDGIRIAARDQRPTIDVASTARVDVHDLMGVQAAAGNGIVLETDGTGTMSGAVARVDVGGSGASALSARKVAGVNLSQVRVTGFSGSGLLLDRASSMRLDRVEITGPPQAHGIELRNTRDITIVDSRVDLRSPVPEIPQDPPPYQEPCRSRFDPRGVNPVPDQPRRAGIFARHVGGQLSVTNTTVRGATLHQIVALNGPSFPDPEIEDPAPAVESDGRLALSGLTLLDTPDGRNGLVAGAGTGGRMKVELAGAGPISTDAPLLVCAVDGGQVAGSAPGEAGITGGPVISVTGPGDALVLKAAGAEDISPPPSSPFLFPPQVVNPAFVHFLLDGLSVDFDAPDAAGRALVTISELYGIVTGSARNTTITDAPENGLELRGVRGVLVDGVRVVRPQGDGIVVAGSSDVELRTVVIEQAAGTGVSIDRSQDVVVGDVTIVEPGAGGIRATSSKSLTLRSVDVERPAGHAVEAHDVHTLTVEDLTADFTADSDTPAPSAPVSAVLARHVGGAVGLSGIRSNGSTAHAIAAVNGTGFPEVVDSPSGTAVETDADLALSDVHTEGTAAGSDAVLVGAGPDGTLDVDLDGAASTLDGRFRIESAGGVLTVAGGHALTVGGPGDALAIVNPASVALEGMSVAFSSAVPAGARGAGIRISGAQGTTISGSSVEGAGVGVAVDGADVVAVSSTSATGSRDTGVSILAADVAMTDVTVDGAGGTGVVVRSATGATLTGTVTRNAAAGIDLAGAGAASVTRSRVGTVSGIGLSVTDAEGPLCADLVDNDVSETDDVNFQLVDVGLKDFRSTAHPAETVEEWLMRKQNRTVGGTELRSTDVRAC